jgi:putative SOS response-associated peptidase YedK
MCGRYVLFTDEEEDEITDLVNEIQQRLREEQGAAEDAGTELRTNGEVFPSQLAPVISKAGPAAMRWGLPGFKGQGLIINARSESVYGKVMFRTPITERRVAVLSHGFFEWQKVRGSAEKQKLLINLPDARGLYLAGLYNDYPDGSRFAIITTEANESMKPVHNRMPVLLLPNEVEEYLNSERLACEILGRIPPRVEYRAA